MVLQLLRGEIRHGQQPGDIRKTRILERFDGEIATGYRNIQTVLCFVSEH